MSQVRPIEDLFAELIELKTSAQREEYLDQLCGDDELLRGRLQKLLSAHEQAGSFLNEGQSIAATKDADHDRLVGSNIGPYKLREVIGEGGMGTVYVAEQEKPLRRKVAIKVIKPGMDSKAVTARFEAERNALAMMNHPNIAKVLDAGTTEQGRPFFAMELVSGIPITQYCDEHGLNIPQRLELFTQVCQAIQHAHHKGIIHRDIKPSNVLVTELDGKPIPKVIDFGVAKALHQSLTEQSIYTSFQSVIGTPLYMSPEQASLSAVDVDTRSDVYSLGVLLYELLTSTTPFESSRLREAAQHEVLRIIREEEPPKPSNRISTLGETAAQISKLRQTQPDRLGRQVKGDLDWIVMTAMAKERSRRYESASRFADDVQHFLRNEAVDARPPSAFYAFRKYAAKHRGFVLSATIVLLVLVGGIVGSGWQANRALQAERKAQLILDELRNELASVALNAVFSSNHRDAEDATKRAAKAEAPDDLIQTLRGVALLLNDKNDEAVQLLTKATGENPDSIKANAALFWAHWQNGDFGRMDMVREKIRGEKWTGDDFDKLFLAIVRQAVGSPNDLQEMEKRLTELIRRHPQWGIAFSLRSSNHRELGMESKQIRDFEAAVDDLEQARRLVPESSFIDSQGIYMLTTAIELAQNQNRDCHEWMELAETIVGEFEEREDYTSGREHVSQFLYRFRDVDAARALESTLIARGVCENSPKWAEMFAIGELADLETELRSRPGDVDAEICLALLLIEKSADGRVEAMQIFDRLMNRDLPSTYYALALDIPLLLGVPQKAREVAGRVSKGDQLTQWRWWGYMTEFYAGNLTETELLERAGPFSNTGCLAKYAIAIKSLSEGDRQTALKYFAEVRETRRVAWSPYHWGAAFASRLEEKDRDWGEWIAPRNSSR